MARTSDWNSWQPVNKPFGLKVACYGCLLTDRRPNLTAPKHPPSWSGLSGGAQTVAGPTASNAAVNFTLASGVVIQLTNAILDSAAAGADCIMVGCPLCHGNLDIRQKEIEGVYKTDYNLPVFYLTQLVGLATGLSADKLGLGAMIVNPLPLLKEKGLL